MAEFVKNLMTYPGIFFLMFLENVFPPLPSELIMPLAGFQASQGKLTLWGVILAGSLGSLVGQLPLYYLGKVMGYERLKEWADKHGEWLTVSGEEVHRAKDWFDKHGNKAVLFGRLVPGIRSLVSIPAGFAHMPMGRFLIYSAIGKVAWTGLLAWLGTLLGQRYETVDRYLGPVTYIVLGGIALYMVFTVIKRKKQRKQQGGGEQRREAHV